MGIIKKIFNPIYLIALLLSGVLYYFVQTRASSSDTFFGFAENRETEINLDYPVKVNSIKVQPGEFIKAGKQMAELTQLAITKEIKDEELRINQLNSQFETKRNSLDGEIRVLKSQLFAETQSLKSKIEKIRQDYAYQKSLKEGLSTIGNEKDESAKALMESEIQVLEKRIIDVESNYQTKINAKNQRIGDEQKAYKTAINKHYSDVGFAEQKLKKLSLTSPTDAVIGNVHIKEGEYIAPFKAMITLYEPNPTIVAGFVHESMVVNVKIGDVYEIRSLLNAKNVCQGKITGLGSRIVEIPERLRKIPTLKTYGREVIFSIPSENHFLQKEKVVIKPKSSN